MPIDDRTVTARLEELGLTLPPPPQALAAYVPCVVHDGVAYVAGQVPVLRATLGSFDRLVRILQVTVYVAAPDGTAEHPQVANGASELLVDVLGEEGRHARAAVGVASLPLGSSVEVAVTAAVR
jgi:enamine deaminase RidA (YjgF/YER057c/UK114 family)